MSDTGVAVSEGTKAGARSVAIVGGGASGTLVGIRLLQGARSPLDIAIIEPAERLGRGVAYGTSSRSHLLNVPARAMSLYPEAPSHFVDWLRENVQAGIAPESFVERRIYADYIEHELQRARHDAAPRVHLRHVRGWVESARRNEAGARLDLRGGGHIDAHRVVLALGNPPPSNPLGGAAAALDPWRTDLNQGVEKDAAVLLIGSGLTAIDAILALEDSGHRGPIHVVSRHGNWPEMHAPATPVPPLAGAAELPHSARGLAAAIRDKARASIDEGGSWRAAVDALRPHTSEIWKRLDVVEKRRFLRHLQPYWDIHRHRMAPQVAQRLAAMRNDGRVILHRGRIAKADEQPGGAVRVSIRPRGHGATFALEVRRVINCTGPQTDYGKIDQPLVRDLFAQGIAARDELNLGLLTAEDGALIGEGGAVSPTFFTLGPPRKGDLWESTAMPEIRVQAAALARRLLFD
jgi:uncharacterized NAD(P)/FAD-binding protein YdhS